MRTVRATRKPPSSSAGGGGNRLRWRLEVVLNEDQARTSSVHGSHNLAAFRHLAMNVMRKDPTKDSLRGKVQAAGRDNADLASRLALD